MGKYTSQTVDNVNKKQGMKRFDVNLRSVYSMRNCGVGHKGLQRFFGLMNMPKTLTRKDFDRLLNKILDAAENVDKARMLTAASDLKTQPGGSTNIGTSQKRGFSSLNRVVAAISVTNGKVLDVETMSRHCKSWTSNAPLKDSDPQK